MIPGCLGSIISFDSSDDYCISCRYKDQCRQKVGSRLIELRNKLDVSDYLREFNINQGRDDEASVDAEQDEEMQPSRAKLRPASKRVAVRPITKEQFVQFSQDWVPKKAKKLMLQMFRKGIDGRVIGNQLRKRVNPFKNETPVTMRVACDLLLNGGFEKTELKMALMGSSKRQMNSATAIAQVSILTSTLLAIKVAYEKDGRFMLVENNE